jgi:two-component system, NtrC family, sensor kinase
LNEPLASILGFAQLIQLGTDLPEQTRSDIEKVIRASLHAREVVKKLLLFGRQVPSRISRTDLNKIVAEDIYFLESRCANENIVLEKKLDPRLPLVVADASQMHQVLVNLVVNSIQAMAGGGRLTIRTRRRHNGVALIVEDTGHGMSEEVRRQLFTPFFTTKDVGQGTGLGLSVVHGIVSTHGGSIGVESRVGHGSRFEVFLPRQPRRRRTDHG